MGGMLSVLILLFIAGACVGLWALVIAFVLLVWRYIVDD